MSAISLLPICLLIALVLKELPPNVLYVVGLILIGSIGVLFCYLPFNEACYQ